MFKRALLVIIKIFMELPRNLKEPLNTQNLNILRSFQCCPKFLVSYKKYAYYLNSAESVPGLI